MRTTITIPALLKECNEDELAEHSSYDCRPEWFKGSTAVHMAVALLCANVAPNYFAFDLLD
jgi:hypothetical protein